ncbi:MAG: NAD(P)-binding protein, partial [Gammaproteobacteria bacterium]|nr:NAD(P)-binding protein [Gammaproteobacteria bacterium]
MVKPVAREHAEVVIVGAGAAGSVFAAVLAEAGRQVRVLETGPVRR